MPKNHYMENANSNAMNEICKLKNKGFEKKTDFLYHILLISVTLLGVLVSLHPKFINITLSSYCYYCAIVLLALGIILESLVLYNLMNLYHKTAEVAYEKLKLAEKDQTKISPRISESTSKCISIFEKIGYWLLLISILALTIYALTV